MKDFQITEHFRYSEMIKTTCLYVNSPHNHEVVVNLYRLACVLEKIRAYVGMPIRVNSAYRSVRVNRFVGGVSNSDHILGMAADICCDLPASELFQKLREMSSNPFECSFGQVILYSNFVHVSINQAKHINQFMMGRKFLK